MMVALVALSTFLQGVAAALALRLAWSMRRATWLALALAVLLMFVRLALTLADVVILGGAVAVSAELVGLATSVLMLVGMIHLGRIPPFKVSARGDSSASLLPATMLRRLTRTAVVMGVLGLCGTFVVGYHAYGRSRDAFLQSLAERNLSLVRVMAHHADDADNSSTTSERVALIEHTWEQLTGSYPGSYLCVVDATGHMLLHTRDRSLVGQNVGPLTVHGSDSRTMTLRDLVRMKSDWAGRFTSAKGEEQIAAFAYTRPLNAAIAVHMPIGLLDSELRSTWMPWVLGFALVTMVLGPLSLLSLHWAYRRATRVALRAEQAYRQSEGRLGMVVAGAPVVLFAVDKTGVFTLSEGKGLGALGLVARPVVGQSVFEMYADHPQIVEGIRRALEGQQVSTIVEVGGRWLDSHYAPLRDENQELTGVLGVAHDITEFKRIEGQLAQQALRDPLTLLPNRTLFLERLEQAIRRSRARTGHTFAVLFIDLDRFKLVNDSFGHIVGDQLLVATAAMLEDCVRLADTVARLGGDEFTVLLEGDDSEAEAVTTARRVQERLQNPFVVDGHDVFTTASIGIAVQSAAYRHPQDVLRDADTAMYRAKAMGRNRYVVFDEQMHHDAVELLHLDTGLRRALERNEFLVYYQPIVSLASGKLSGFEALLRWQHPERGLVLPDDFMRVAEETGLIVPIGRWVLTQACAQTRIWKQQFPEYPQLTMVVNLSGREWLQTDLVEFVERSLDEAGIRCHDIKLELTENVLIENAEQVRRALTKLRELEIHVYMDDFGTGYSSLSALHTFPIDALKIDRSFVGRMGANGENVEIVRSIVTLGHHLGKYIVAEGVEQKHQLDLLRALDCEYGQGHFFSHPVDSATAATLMAKNPTW